jgi:predicted dehydrogenase
MGMGKVSAPMKTRFGSGKERTQLARVMMTRRRALGVSALGVLGPMVVPGRVLGRDGGVAPSNRIAVGFLGTGRQAIYANLPGFLAEPDAQIVAVCDVDTWRMDRARAKVEAGYAERGLATGYRGCSTHRDWREVVAREDIDAVMISTPDHWHVPMALAALRAGKDVACEKPLTRSIGEGRVLAEAVRKEGRVFRTDSEFRSLRSFHRAAQWVRNGRIGTLQRIVSGTPKDGTLGPQPEMPVPAELDYAMWLGSAPERPYTVQRVHPRHDDRGRPGWICIRDYADGMLANWGSHLNDIAVWAADLEHEGPVSVRATGTFPPAGHLWDVVQEFEATFRFANGVELVCRTETPFLRFEGSEGWIEVRYPNDVRVSDERMMEWEPGERDVRLPFKSSEKRDFLDAVTSRHQPMFDAEAGHRNASLSHLALASMELGRELKWDPVKEEVVDDAEANRRLGVG